MGLSLYTIPEKITIAKYSQCLADEAAATGTLFGPEPDPLLGMKIYTIRKDVEDLYNLDPNNTNGVYDNYAMSEFLFGLCQEYALTAIAVINGGGGSVVPPIVPTGYVWYSMVTTFGDDPSDTNNTSLLTRSVLVNATSVNTMFVNNILNTLPPNFVFNLSLGQVDWSPNKFFTGDVIAMSFFRKI
jgi:hypothetical protein